VQYDAAVTDAPGQTIDRLHVDLACASCGYRLLGEPFDGDCPRCDTSVASTVRRGDLMLCDTAYLRRISQGLLLVLVGLVAQLVTTVGIIMLSVVLQPRRGGSASWFASWEAASSIAGVVVAIVIAQGWWMFTEARRPGPESAATASARRVVRTAVLTHTLFTGVALLGQWLLVLPALTAWQPTLSMTIGLSGVAVLATLAVQFFAVMTLLAHAARGLRDMKLARTVRLRTWSIPLWATLGIIALGLGPIVAWVQYFEVIHRTRRRVNVVVEAHAIGAAALA